MKSDIEKFNGRNDFNLQCIKMHALLDQQGLFKELKDVNIFFKGKDDEEKENLMERLFNFVCLMRF